MSHDVARNIVDLLEKLESPKILVSFFPHSKSHLIFQFYLHRKGNFYHFTKSNFNFTEFKILYTGDRDFSFTIQVFLWYKLHHINPQKFYLCFELTPPFCGTFFYADYKNTLEEISEEIVKYTKVANSVQIIKN